MRDFILKMMVNITAPIYSFVKKGRKKDWGIVMTDLAHYPPESLGQYLYHFLEQHNISPIAKFEYHDIYHLLTGYGITPVDEARMQFFLVGNGKRTVYAIGTLLIALLILPEHIRSFINAYRRGQSIPSFFDFLHCEAIDKAYRIDNTHFLNIPFITLKESINI